MDHVNTANQVRFKPVWKQEFLESKVGCSFVNQVTLLFGDVKHAYRLIESSKQEYMTKKNVMGFYYVARIN